MGKEMMKTICMDAKEEGAVQMAGTILRQGGLVSIPTETVYGLAADAWNGSAVAKIFEAKGRPQDNPLIVHIGEISQLQDLVSEIPKSAKTLMDAFWPGPLTLIFPKAVGVPDEVTAGLPTVAVRFPSHPVAQAVIRAAETPLAAPSANRSGQPSPTIARHVLKDLDGRIDMVLDGGPCGVGVESTVVTLASHSPRILRPGEITREQLEAVLGPIEVDPAVLRPLEKDAAVSSPGMKYKHYAPKAKLVVLEGGYAHYRDYVNQHAAPHVAALCYKGEEAGLAVAAVTYGSREDSRAQARELFDALRRLDEGDFHLVYARCPEPSGVGLAVYNRLIRAAGFEVISLAE